MRSAKNHVTALWLAKTLCLCVRATIHQVSIIDSLYIPENLAIEVGDTVIWTNNDNTEHSVTSTEDDGALFDSGVLPPEEVYSRTFDVAGSFAYNCTQHGRSMAGLIVVVQGNANKPPNIPVNVSPRDNAMEQPVAIQLTGGAFSDPDDIDFLGASQWIVRYASSGFVAVDSGVVTSGGLTNYMPGGLSEGMAYTWQVRYRDGRGLWSEYSAATRFTTLVSVAARGIGLRASYNNDSDFTGPQAVVTNATVAFDWGSSRPHRRITADRFAVRWEGSLLPELTQPYQIQLQYCGRARVWLKDVLVIDEWGDCGLEQTRRATVPLVAGQLAAVRVDYVAAVSNAKAIFRWSAGANLPFEVIPTARLFPPSQ